MGKILTYKSNSFVLRDGARETRIPLKEAVLVKEFADNRAKNLINRIIVKKFSFSGPLSPDLDSHQVDGVRWILTRSRSYLAHAPGAGKTRQAIEASARVSGEGQYLYIIPPTSIANWQREIMKWGGVFGYWPSISVIPESDRRFEVDWGADILLVPHSMLARDWVLNGLVPLRKKLVAVDEASAFKEPESERTKALFGGWLKCGHRSPGLIRDSRFSVLMDGSPSPNGRAMELWAPTYAMAPETIDFMTREEFGFHYCGAKQNDRGQWEFKRTSHADELRRKLQHSFMHVVTESQLDHPERRRKIVFMTDDVRSRDHKEWDRKNLSQGQAVFTEEMSQGDFAHFRAELGMRKAAWVSSYVTERLLKNESILLFAWHRDVVFDLAKRLARFNPGVVMGGTPAREREKYFREFQEGSRKILTLNIASGGRVHNLTRADRVIFGEFSLCPETNTQAEKRASRKGNEKAFTPCDYIACPGSLDEPVLGILFRKENYVRKLIG